MIYFIFGNDLDKSLVFFQKTVDKFLSGQENFSISRIDEESFSESFFENAIKAGSLFSEKSLVTARNLFTNPSAVGYLQKNFARVSSSDNIFVFWEKELESKLLAKIREHSINVHEFSAKGGGPDIKKQESNRLFLIADTFARRDKNKTWMLYQEELLKGTSADEIFWKIVWQVKALLTVKNGGGKDLNPFPREKAKKFCNLFNEKELKKCSTELVELYHKCRDGKSDLAVGLEKIILKN